MITSLIGLVKSYELPDHFASYVTRSIRIMGELQIVNMVEIFFQIFLLALMLTNSILMTEQRL